MSTNETNITETIKSASTPPVKPKMKNTSITVKSNQQKKKKMDLMSTYILDTDYETNTNTIIKYYEQFTLKRIDSLLEEAYANLQYATVNNLDYFKGEQQDLQFMHYISFLAAVRFTSLDKEVPNTLPEQIPVMLDMYETGLLTRIHDEVLPQEEFYKIIEKLESFTVLANKIDGLEDSTRNEILSSVQNKEILNYTQSQPDVIHPLVNPKADK